MKHEIFRKKAFFIPLVFAVGGVMGIGTAWLAAAVHRTIPTEHKGVGAELLGKLTEKNLQAQIELDGYVFQMREISVAPGGQIARHSHANRPGLVWTTAGELIEGRDTGETLLQSGTRVALLEDESTDHWFYNVGEKPATMVVCDIVAAPR